MNTQRERQTERKREKHRDRQTQEGRETETHLCKNSPGRYTMCFTSVHTETQNNYVKTPLVPLHPLTTQEAAGVNPGQTLSVPRGACSMMPCAVFPPFASLVLGVGRRGGTLGTPQPSPGEKAALLDTIAKPGCAKIRLGFVGPQNKALFLVHFTSHFFSVIREQNRPQKQGGNEAV